MKKKSISGGLKQKVHEKSHYKCTYCGKTADMLRGGLAYEFNPAYEVSVILDEIEYRKSSAYRHKSIFDIDIYVSFDVDHIIPEFKGGKTTIENLTLACRSCNRSKGVKIDGMV